jgi:hypothetical protein
MAYTEAQYSRAVSNGYVPPHAVFFRIGSHKDIKRYNIDLLMVVLPDFSLYPEFYKCVTRMAGRDKISVRSAKRKVYKITEHTSLDDIKKEKTREENLSTFMEIGS